MKAEYYASNKEVLYSQFFLFKNKEIFRKIKNTFSQGRTFCYLDVKGEEIIQRLKATLFPPRILLHYKQHEYDHVSKQLHKMGYNISPPLIIMIGDQKNVTKKTLNIINSFQSKEEKIKEELNHSSQKELIRAFQKLQDDSGIIPVPGWIIRGLDGKTTTIIIKNEIQSIIAGMSTQLITFKKKVFTLGFGLCVSECYRGKKIGLLLNAIALNNSIGSSHYAIEIVSEKNFSSIEINKKCGLKKLDNHFFIFAEKYANQLNIF